MRIQKKKSASGNGQQVHPQKQEKKRKQNEAAKKKKILINKTKWHKVKKIPPYKNILFIKFVWIYEDEWIDKRW